MKNGYFYWIFDCDFQYCFVWVKPDSVNENNCYKSKYKTRLFYNLLILHRPSNKRTKMFFLSHTHTALSGFMEIIILFCLKKIKTERMKTENKIKIERTHEKNNKNKKKDLIKLIFSVSVVFFCKLLVYFYWYYIYCLFGV